MAKINMRNVNRPFLINFIYFVVSLVTCEAIVCYKCDSMQLAACAMTLDGSELPYAECGRSLQCVMSIVDSITYRGCSEATPIAGATFSKSCNTNLCNKQVYPPGRLKCHHCSDAACVAAPIGKPHPCRYHNLTDSCYTEVRSTQEVYRGCLSDKNHTITGPAEHCDINSCNDQAAVSTLNCAACDSRHMSGCKMDLFGVNQPICNITQFSSCAANALLTQPASCFVYRYLDHVVRGCSQNRPSDLNPAYITECSHHDYCNQACVPQQLCLTCNSRDNEICRSDPISLSRSFCPSPEASSCYACEYSDMHIVRGCGAKPENASFNRCYECADADKCNAKNFTRCYKCSSDIDVSCATWALPGYLEIDECSVPEATCITASYANGTTVRGCESMRLNCKDTSTELCQRCVGSFCNKQPHPAARLNCHQCSGHADCDNITSKSMPCTQHSTEPTNAPQACFEYFDYGTGGMIRGCRSNSSLYYSCMLQDSNCRVCHDHGCNSSPAYTMPQLSCYTCERNDLSCQLPQASAGQLKPCRGRIPFGKDESCFITRHFDGSITRGCTFDRSNYDLDEKWDQSVYCYENACNNPATIMTNTLKNLDNNNLNEMLSLYRGTAVSLMTVKSNQLFLISLIFVILHCYVM